MINCDECPFKERIQRLEDKVDILSGANAEMPYIKEKIEKIEKTMENMANKLDVVLNSDSKKTVENVKYWKTIIISGFVGCAFTILGGYILSTIINGIK